MLHIPGLSPTGTYAAYFNTPVCPSSSSLDGVALMQRERAGRMTSTAELEECRALRAFYRACRGKRWYRKDGWSTPNRHAPQVCLNDFEGVTVRQDGCVDEIRLASNRLWTARTRERGWRTLRSLRYLTVLDLSNNSLRGTVVYVCISSSLSSLEVSVLDQ